MKRLSRLAFIGCLSLIVSMGVGVSHAYDPMGEETSVGSNKPLCDKNPFHGLVSPLPRPVTGTVVADWPPCARYRDSLTPTKLCKAPAERIDWNARTYLDRRLRAGPTYLISLCEIDASIVQAQRDCELGTRNRNERHLSDLMNTLANTWKLHGVYERADQLYAQAFALASADEIFTGETKYVLAHWADLKVRMGDGESARKLVHQRTEMERREYENGRAFDPISCSITTEFIAEALRIEAIILERLGFGGEADLLWQEIEKLSPKPEPCEGVCGG